MGTKYLGPNEKILVRQKLQGEKRLSQIDIYSLLEQSPNDRFLGLPISLEVHLYYWGLKHHDTISYTKQIERVSGKYSRKIGRTEKPKKVSRLKSSQERKINRWKRKINEGNWRMRQGKPLAVFDSSKHSRSVDNYDQVLMNQGFFNGFTQFTTKQKNTKYIETRYNLIKNKRYVIDSIAYEIADEKVEQLVLLNEYLGLKKGTFYSQNIVSNERDRLFNLMSDNGYFNFQRQFIRFELDTVSLNSGDIFLKCLIKAPSIEDDAYTLFRIDSISFISDSNVEKPEKKVSENYAGVNFQFGRNKYNKELLSRRLFLKKDSLYSRQDAFESQRQLANLDAFKFININYDTTGGKFVAAIFTSPLNKYQTSNEVGLSSTAGFPGPFLNVGFKNRNIFKGIALLEINGNLNLQGIGNISDEDRNYTLLQYGGVVSLNFPQFLFPLQSRLKERVHRYNPRTSLSFSYSFEDRFTEYERQIVNTTLSYQWQVRDVKSFTLTPLGIGFVQSNLEPEFREFLDTLRSNGNGSYAASFESALITTASVDAVFNNNYNKQSAPSASFLRLFAESGGNVLNSIGATLLKNDSVQYQFMKFRIDYRRKSSLDRNTVLATRVHFGIAYPYGKDPIALPYEKYFYIGGSNSLRAWPARRLGPGDYSVYSATEGGETRNINYTLEQGGDMILETSIEVRKKITSFLNWAAFIDAGNIWQIQSSPLLPLQENVLTSQRGGLFQLNSFIREIAVGAGLGLRIDFGYLVFRVDGAVQVLDPGQAANSRFVLDNINFLSAFQKVKDPDSNEGIKLQNQKSFLRNKTRLNFGIGFPF